MQRSNSKLRSQEPSDNKILIAAFVVFVAVILGVILHLSHSHTVTTTNHQTKQRVLPSESVVSLRDSGFDPQEITVTKGTAVRWTNASSANKASINSDDYPTNRLYPELNLGVFLKGSTLVHIFEKSGTYTYHNEFNPKQVGMIHVK